MATVESITDLSTESIIGVVLPSALRLCNFVFTQTPCGQGWEGGLFFAGAT